MSMSLFIFVVGKNQKKMFIITVESLQFWKIYNSIFQI